MITSLKNLRKMMIKYSSSANNWRTVDKLFAQSNKASRKGYITTRNSIKRYPISLPN
jgi:hypothetical protein